jgi:hypothetical protein
VCSAQYGWFFYFTNFVIFTYITQVLSKWFCKGAVAHIVTGVTFAFTFHMLRISSMKSVYLKIFSANFFIIFLSPNNATSINMHIPLLFLRIMLTSLLLAIDQSDPTCCFHNMVTLTSWLVSTDFLTFSCYCSLCNFTSISLHYV